MERRLGIWAAVPMSALQPTIDPAGFRTLVWADDLEEGRDEKERMALWRGALLVYQLLRKLPHLWMVTARGCASVDYAALGHLRDKTGTGALGQWADFDIYADYP